VLGSTFESALLSDVVDGDGGATAGAVRRLGAFLESAGTGLLRFRNECYRQVAYQTLPFSRRRDLHARAGEAIERSLRDDDAERAGVLSFHFLNALRYDKCWTYALMAAAGAARQYANAEAVELYERALVASPHLADLEHGVVAAAWEALADRALDAGMFDRARAAYGRARRLRAGDVTALAQLCQKESRAAWHQGRAVASVRWIRRGLRYVEGSTDPAHVAVRATLRMLYAQNRQLAGRHRETVRWCELAIEDATASGNRQALADAYTVLDGAYMASGHPEHAVHGALALAIWEDLGLAERQAGLLTHLGAFAYWQGHWDEALALFAKGRDAYLRAGNVVDAAYGTCNISEILIDQGLADEAEPGLLEAIDVWRSVHHPAPIAGALVNLGRIALRRNDFERALGLFEEAGAASETAIVEADAWLAECLLRQGEAEQAAKLLEPAIKREAASGGTTFVAKLHRLRGYVLAALDRIDEAWPEFQTSLDAGRARGATYEIALTLEAISAVAASAGLPADADAEDERSRLLAQLGVRSTAPPPLPAFAAAS
jgi:tetratricopeptide (TPR) repeat protein